MSYSTWHWRVYNVLRRVVSLAFAAGGAVFVADGVRLLADPAAAVPVNGVPTPGLGPKLLTLAVGLLTLAGGVSGLRLRPYRPDLGDRSWWAGLSAAAGSGVSPPEGRRSWWTRGVRQGPGTSARKAAERGVADDAVHRARSAHPRSASHAP